LAHTAGRDGGARPATSGKHIRDDGQNPRNRRLLSNGFIVTNIAFKSGSRAAIVFNGSPLFTGAAGSGESEIRRWIIEND
jgi:hypothetical protein